MRDHLVVLICMWHPCVKRLKMASSRTMLRVINLKETLGLQHVLLYVNRIRWKWFLRLHIWLIKKNVTYERAKRRHNSKK